MREKKNRKYRRSKKLRAQMILNRGFLNGRIKAVKDIETGKQLGPDNVFREF